MALEKIRGVSLHIFKGEKKHRIITMQNGSPFSKEHAFKEKYIHSKICFVDII